MFKEEWVIEMAGIEKRIRQLEKEISELPRGYISRKTIGGKIRKYYQWTEDGKKKSRYLKDEAASDLEELIDLRREKQQELKTLKQQFPEKQTDIDPYSSLSYMKRQGKGSYGAFYLAEEGASYNGVNSARSEIIIGESLEEFIAPIRKFKKRDCFGELKSYLENGPAGKVFVLYGLRRTGKTTLIKQAIASLSKTELKKTAFIQVTSQSTLAGVNTNLRRLRDEGFRYVFIDEVTLAEDFIEGAALLSDIYAASGMRIVLSGTDSLGFMFSRSGELYDRCILLHTTFIPYREFERVLGVKGIDEYIRYGGTMSLSGQHYNGHSTFETKEGTDEYIDSAIARNIQHSLRFYQKDGRFGHLAELYEKNELTSAINRVVEDINHQFTINVLTRDFISHDLGISKRNLRKDRKAPTKVLDQIDGSAFNEELRVMLEILNKSELTVEISEAHRVEIKEYLDLLDLTVEIPTETIPVRNEKLFRTAIAQPGLRYSQADALVRQLLRDEDFQKLSAKERASILDRIRNEILGRMMEDIVLLETKAAYPDKEVFRLQFDYGEFDMVIVNTENITCEIFEIKHSTEAVPEQLKNLADREKCDAVEFRYGTITGKSVLYRGESKREGDISYVNVEEYLRSLGKGNAV